MAKFIGVLVCLCATSLFFFPVTLVGMPPNLNTKLVMAVIGLPLLGYNLSKSSGYKIESRLISWFGLACCVSLATYLSVALNNTADYTYVTYVVSMMVWTMAAYVSLKLIEFVHGYVDVKLIILYLMGMCTLQCILAIAIDMNVDVQQFVDRFYPDSAWLHEKKRMYGFGCCLDVAGGRFAVVLIMIAYLLYHESKKDDWRTVAFYMTCFIIISVIGNMIGRTTTVGMVLGVLVIIYSVLVKGAHSKYIKSVAGIGMAIVIVTVVLYNTNQRWHNNLEFGFEGFFSLVEKGKWEVHSNEMLKEGFIFPDNAKTWLIGDGYFEEPANTDPYYTGRSFYGYYMGTDSGYSRFLFYFGLIGLLAFSAFFVETVSICAGSFPEYKYIFWGILVLNFAIWVKVSTDIYVTLAPFICLCMMKSMQEQEEIFTSRNQIGRNFV